MTKKQVDSNKYYFFLEWHCHGHTFQSSFLLNLLLINLITIQYLCLENKLLQEMDATIIIWEKELSGFSLFVEYLNQNTLGLNFTCHHHRSSIEYLDVFFLMGKPDGLFTMKTCFKNVEIQLSCFYELSP